MNEKYSNKGKLYSEALEATYPLTVAVEEIISRPNISDGLSMEEHEVILSASLHVEDFVKKHEILDQQTSIAILAGVREFLRVKQEKKES